MSVFYRPDHPAMSAEIRANEKVQNNCLEKFLIPVCSISWNITKIRKLLKRFGYPEGETKKEWEDTTDKLVEILRGMLAPLGLDGEPYLYYKKYTFLIQKIINQTNLAQYFLNLEMDKHTIDIMKKMRDIERTYSSYRKICRSQILNMNDREDSIISIKLGSGMETGEMVYHTQSFTPNLVYDFLQKTDFSRDLSLYECWKYNVRQPAKIATYSIMTVGW